MAVGVIGIAAQIGDILLLIILVTDSDCVVSNRRMGCPGRIIMRPDADNRDCASLTSPYPASFYLR